jgi:hypothetical protein
MHKTIIETQLNVLHEIGSIEYLLSKSEQTESYYRGMRLIYELATTPELSIIAMDYLVQAVLTTTREPIEGEEHGVTIAYYLDGFKLALDAGIATSEALTALASYE